SFAPGQLLGFFSSLGQQTLVKGYLVSLRPLLGVEIGTTLRWLIARRFPWGGDAGRPAARRSPLAGVGPPALEFFAVPVLERFERLVLYWRPLARIGGGVLDGIGHLGIAVVRHLDLIVYPHGFAVDYPLDDDININGVGFATRVAPFLL